MPKYDYYTADAMLQEIERRLSVLEANHAIAVLNAETGTDPSGNLVALSAVEPTHMVATGTVAPPGVRAVGDPSAAPENHWQTQADSIWESIEKLRAKRDEVKADVEALTAGSTTPKK